MKKFIDRISWWKQNKHTILLLLLILFVSLPAVWSLLKYGFFLSDDGEWMVIRLSAFYQTLRDGQIPVRFLGRLNFGYGYPVPNFLYPGFMYLGALIHIFGFGFVSTIKIIFGVSFVGSVIFCYLWLRKLFAAFPSMIGSLLYIYTPYHLYDVYKRGSVGEVLALAVVPFILWQIERQSIFWITLGIALLILSHNTIALLFLPVIILYGIVRNQDKRKGLKIYQYISILVLGFGISAFFWLPAFAELSLTHFRQTQISNPHAYFADISLIGLPSVILLIASSLLVFKDQPYFEAKLRINLNKVSLVFFILGILSVFFSSSLSSLFWDIIPSSFVQFPFRLLSYLLLSNAFLGALVVSYSSKRQFKVVTIVGIIIFAYSAFPFLAPKEFFDKGDAYYATNEDTTTVAGEYLPVWVQQKPSEHFKNKVEALNGKGKIESVKYNNKQISFSIFSQTPISVTINTIYYPGWVAKINGKEAQIFYDNPQGVMQIKVPEGQSTVSLKFTETNLRLLADVISIISFILLLFYASTSRKKKFKKQA